MKKKIAVLLAAGMVLASVSCAKAPEETAKETTEETTVTSETQSETSEEVTDTQIQYPTDIDSQLKIIAKNYVYIKSDYFSYAEAYPDACLAVTDLNHNGRLELIVTSIQGSGVFSNSFFYEISEDYSTLERLTVDGEIKADEAGDFLMSKNNENHIALYDCYMKDGEYYYLLEDYASAGWSYKFLMYYAYSFDGGVTRGFIGGCELSAELVDDKTVVSIWLHGPSNVLFESDEAYLEHLNSFWSGYEKQSSCEIKWMEFTKDTDFAYACSESYKGFNPNSSAVASITYDYHYFFDSFYGDGGNAEVEYVIKDS